MTDWERDSEPQMLVTLSSASSRFQPPRRFITWGNRKKSVTSPSPSITAPNDASSLRQHMHITNNNISDKSRLLVSPFSWLTNTICHNKIHESTYCFCKSSNTRILQEFIGMLKKQLMQEMPSAVISWKDRTRWHGWLPMKQIKDYWTQLELPASSFCEDVHKIHIMLNCVQKYFITLDLKSGTASVTLVTLPISIPLKDGDKTQTRSTEVK